MADQVVPFDIQTNQASHVTLLRDLVQATKVRLFGSSLTGPGINSGADAATGTFPETVTTTGSGTGTIAAGQLVMRTGAVPGSTSTLRSNLVAAFITGSVTGFESGIQVPASPVTFAIVSRKAGIDTPVFAANFNVVPNYPVDNLFHRFSMEFTASDVVFYADAVAIHRLSGNVATQRTDTLDLPLAYDLINVAGVTTVRWGMYTDSGVGNGYFFEATYPIDDVTMNVRGSSALRFGPIAVVSGVVISTTNSSTTPLGAGLSFVGAAESLVPYQELDVNVAGAPAIAPGTLFIEFSPDSTHWDVSIPLALAGPSTVPQFFRVVLPFYRIRYVNGVTPLTEFRLTTVLHNLSATRLTRYLNQVIDNTEPVQNNRAILAASDGAGTYPNVTTTVSGGSQALDVAVKVAVFPAGAATEAKQDVGNASLASINATLDVPLSSRASQATLATRVADATITARLNTLGQKVMAASAPVVIASDQSVIPVSATIPGTVDVSDRAARLVGHVTVDSSALPTGAATEATLATRVADATITARLGVLGQAAMAASAPVVIASNQSAVPISAVALPLPAGAATEATLATRVADATVTARLGVLGQAVMAASAPVVIASNQSAVPISAAALPLPAGAATEATLATRAAATQLPAALVGGRLDENVGAWLGSTAPTIGQKVMASSIPVVLASDETVPISAAALPLPAGAATEATLATRLADATFTARINTQGQKTMAASTPVVLASDETVPISAAALPLPAGAATEATLATRAAATQLPAALVGGRLDENLGAWLGSTAPTVGSKTSANSVPVVIASDQGAVPVTGPLTDTQLRASPVPISAAALPLPAGAATEATLATRAAATQLPAALVGGRLDENVGAWLGSTAPTVGQKTMANSVPIVISSDQTALAITAAALPLPAGAATEATLATRAAATQLPAALVGGRLDENVGAWLGSTAPTVGQKTMANSVPIVLASDQSSVPTTEKKSATGTETNVASSATNVTLLAANANRLGATIYNDSTKVLMVKLGATASATSFTVALNNVTGGIGGYFEVPFGYTGIIDGIWTAANGSARITELT